MNRIDGLKRSLFVAGAVTVASVFTAAAADLPVPASSPTGWAGQYVGVSGGFGWGHSSQTDFGPPPGGGGGGCDGPCGDGHYSLHGGLIGGTLGHNWQTANWVYGLEGDYSWADISGRSLCGSDAFPMHGCGTRLSSLGTLRGRLGFAAGHTGDLLFYATGGAAFGHVHGWDALTSASGAQWRAGWVVGGGVEAAFARGWTAKLEYLHVDLGSAQLFDIVPLVPETVSFNTNIVRAGINYRLPADRAATKWVASEPLADWTGFYLGGHVGAASARSDWMFQQDDWAWSTDSRAIPFRSKTGLLGGAQAGFNYQFGWVVAGVEATWSGLDNKTTIVSPFYPQFDTETTRIKNLFTIAGRLGLTWDRVLIYGKGGWAGGQVELSAASTCCTDIPNATTWNSGSRLASGVVVGGGIEYMLTRNLIVGVEYNHIDLGRSSFMGPNIGDDTSFVVVDAHTTVDTVVGRLSYKFDALGGHAGR